MRSCARRRTQLALRFGRCPPFGWFALDADQCDLRDIARTAPPPAACVTGACTLSRRRPEHDLGQVAAMPFRWGIAAYNIANLAGAALPRHRARHPAGTIAAVFARFGANLTDNPGRMMRFESAGAQVLIDYAHNPDGLRGFLRWPITCAARGRLGLLLGPRRQPPGRRHRGGGPGGRRFRPDFIVVKEDEAHLRGRAPGEIPRIIRAELLRSGCGNPTADAQQRTGGGPLRARMGAARRRARPSAALAKRARGGGLDPAELM